MCPGDKDFIEMTQKAQTVKQRNEQKMIYCTSLKVKTMSFKIHNSENKKQGMN